MRPSVGPLVALCAVLVVVVYMVGEASGQFTAAGQAVHINDGNFSKRDHMKQESIQDQADPHPWSDSAFILKVQVNDALSRQQLSQAVVDVYINYTKSHTVLTGEEGQVLLHVPYQAGVPLTLVASKGGYICTLLPFKADRLPIFSSVTMSLLGLNEGNIWLFEDFILISGKSSDSLSWPVVQFPKSLLNLTHSTNVTLVKSFVTTPKLLQEEDSLVNTLGIVSSASGYISVDLRPLAAASVQLFSGDTELHISGPIELSLSIPATSGLQTSNVIPAWFFNHTTGGWMRKGLGTVKSIDGKLLWTFSAPHLGYWMAAPLNFTRGFSGPDVTIDYILHHSSFLFVMLGGMLIIGVCLLRRILCNHSEAKTKEILSAMRKDQSTSTHGDKVLEVSLVDSSHVRDGVNLPFMDNESVISEHIANPSAMAIEMECNGLELNSDLNDLTCLHRTTDNMRDDLIFYNQPVAILHAPAFFHLEEHLERNKSATLPRAGATIVSAGELLSADNFGQTASKHTTQDQAEEPALSESSQETASTNTSRAHFSLPESISAAGTLNKIKGSRHSVHAMAELSEIPPLQAPRAWFVSLEGKPAAEIHYAVSEQQRRRRPVESRETSLDSGVDMSELNQTSGRRVTLERNVTFLKSSIKNIPPQ